MQSNTFSVVLKKAFMLTPSVKHFIFHRAQEPAFTYVPGQFVTIHFEHEGKVLRRSYSIANIPANDNIIEFAASYVQDGPGTQLLFNLKEGDSIQMSGPFGRLTLKEERPERYILIATSTGVTPYRSMIHELQQRLDANPKLKVVIIIGVQKREDILYNDELLAWAARCPRVTFRAHLSRETNEPWREHECKGHVQTSFSELQLNPEQDMIYLCGNPAMIDESFAQLKDIGFTTQNIVREKYISSK